MIHNFIALSATSLFLLSSASALSEEIPPEVRGQQANRVEAIEALKNPKESHGLDLQAIKERYLQVQERKKYQPNDEIDIAERVMFYRDLRLTIKERAEEIQKLKNSIKENRRLREQLKPKKEKIESKIEVLRSKGKSNTEVRKLQAKMKKIENEIKKNEGIEVLQAKLEAQKVILKDTTDRQRENIRIIMEEFGITPVQLSKIPPAKIPN